MLESAKMKMNKYACKLNVSDGERKITVGSFEVSDSPTFWEISDMSVPFRTDVKSGNAWEGAVLLSLFEYVAYEEFRMVFELIELYSENGFSQFYEYDSRVDSVRGRDKFSLRPVTHEALKPQSGADM